MWALIQRNQVFNPLFPPGLLAGLFWEETMFTNRRQEGGPAVGFGQIQVRDWGWKLAKYDPRYASETAVLGDDDFSVHYTSFALNYLTSEEHRDLENSLRVYAGVDSRPVNKDAVTRWKRCRDLLLAANFTSEAVKTALMAAKPMNDGPWYEDFWNFVLRGLPSAQLAAGMEAAISEN